MINLTDSYAESRYFRSFCGIQELHLKWREKPTLLDQGESVSRAAPFSSHQEAQHRSNNTHDVCPWILSSGEGRLSHSFLILWWFWFFAQKKKSLISVCTLMLHEGDQELLGSYPPLSLPHGASKPFLPQSPVLPVLIIGNGCHCPKQTTSWSFKDGLCLKPSVLLI